MKRNKLLPALLDLLYPNIGCMGCGKETALAKGECFCASCVAKFSFLKSPADLGGVSAFAVLEYKPPVSLMIQRLKYNGDRYLIPALCSLLLRGYPPAGFTADALVPVPIHPKRKRMRGFNQAALLASRLSEETGLPMLENALTRQIDTRSQTGLDAQSRRKNVSGAFHAASPVEGKRLLLIDDVLTTGSTVRNAPRPAFCGAKQVYPCASKICPGRP
jgi:ComF family protein